MSVQALHLHLCLFDLERAISQLEWQSLGNALSSKRGLRVIRLLTTAVHIPFPSEIPWPMRTLGSFEPRKDPIVVLWDERTIRGIRQSTREGFGHVEGGLSVPFVKRRADVPVRQ